MGAIAPRSIHTRKMRVIFAIFAIALIGAYAVPSEDVPEEVLEVEDNESFLQAQASIDAMKKKGATEADCKDLAKTSCKAVEDEVSNDQKKINAQKDGNQCTHLGVAAVRKATVEYHRTVTEHKKAKHKVSVTHSANVHIGHHVYSSLRAGNCNFAFGSRAYLTAKANYESSVKIEAMWTGKVRESLRAKLLVEASSRRQIKKCRCDTKKARNSLWSIVTSRSRRTKQVRAHEKCKMMACVLNGTPLSSSKCKSNLQRLVNKRLVSATESVKC